MATQHSQQSPQLLLTPQLQCGRLAALAVLTRALDALGLQASSLNARVRV